MGFLILLQILSKLSLVLIGSKLLPDNIHKILRFFLKFGRKDDKSHNKHIVDTLLA